MGYNTEFVGYLKISPEIKEEHKDYINQFSKTRRMKRKPSFIPNYDPYRTTVNLPMGEEGCYYVSGSNEKSKDVIDYNKPPTGQPGLWCNWIIDENGNLVWNEIEKFYNYIEWLKYLIQHFFIPWGYVLNGEIKWRGEEFDDVGVIEVTDNVIEVDEFIR